MESVHPKLSSMINFDKKLSDTVEILINLRNQARLEKNFLLSDQIRDKLANIGINLKDGVGNTSFKLD